MTKNFKKLKADTRYKYRNREGDIVTLIETGNARYPFECVSGRFNFTAEGDFYADDFLGSNPYDLIELIPDENGYFPHTPGDPMPVDRNVIVQVKTYGCVKAKFFNWNESGDITGYKIIEEKPERNFETLKVGRRYKARDGEVVKITLPYLHKYPFSGDTGKTYTNNGCYYFDKKPDSNDLIELLEEPEIDVVQEHGADAFSCMARAAMGDDIIKQQKKYNTQFTLDVEKFALNQHLPDKELSAIQIMLALPAEARARVMEYLKGRG